MVGQIPSIATDSDITKSIPTETGRGIQHLCQKRVAVWQWKLGSHKWNPHANATKWQSHDRFVASNWWIWLTQTCWSLDWSCAISSLSLGSDASVGLVMCTEVKDGSISVWRWRKLVRSAEDDQRRRGRRRLPETDVCGTWTVSIQVIESLGAMD